MMTLTPKMLDALGHYAKHRNKTDAYRHAYNTENMKPTTVNREAFDLFEHPLVAQAVAQMKTTAEVEVKVNAAWVLKRASLLADFNINKFIVIQDDGTAVYDFRNATDDDWYCISEYTVDRIVKGAGPGAYEVDRVKLKATCKLRALELVGKHTDVQAFKEQIELTGAMAFTQLNAEEFKQARRDMLKDDDC